MWTRKQLKERGMFTFRKNYWRCVLVAIVVMVIGGSQGYNAVTAAFSIPQYNAVRQSISSLFDSLDRSQRDFSSPTNMAMDDYPFGDDEFGFDPDFGESGGYGSEDGSDGMEDFFENLFSGGEAAGAMFAGVLIILIIVFFIFLAIVAAVKITLDILIFNPLMVGADKFFVQNLNSDGEVGTLGFAFDRYYKNQIKVMFFRSLYTFLWSMLFLIPGIIKSYEYRMIPYLLSEYPDMDEKTAFETSKSMMYGEKWNVFVLDLSFIGWHLLSGMTGGILGLFYVNPYYESTCAALYEALKIIKGSPVMVHGNDGGAFAQGGGWQEQNMPEQQGGSEGQWQDVRPSGQRQDASRESEGWHQPAAPIHGGNITEAGSTRTESSWGEPRRIPAPGEEAAILQPDADRIPVEEATILDPGAAGMSVEEATILDPVSAGIPVEEATILDPGSAGIPAEEPTIPDPGEPPETGVY